MPFGRKLPASLLQWLTLVSMAVLAGIGEVMVIKSPEVTEAAMVAPIRCTPIA